MKVLQICQRDDLATGGAARVAVEYTRKLAANGVDSSCVFVYGEEGAFSSELPGQCFHLGLRSSRDAAGGVARLRRLIGRQGFDLLHHHDGLIWTHLVTRSLRGRILRVGHGHLSPPPRQASWRNRLACHLQAHTYDHLVAVSEATRRDWVDAGFPTERTSVIPNGIDLVRFRVATPAEREGVRAQWHIRGDETIVGWVGRLDSAMKGCPEFIDLIADLPTNYLGILAGDGPDRISLEQYARDRGVANRLRFLGTVDPASVVYPGLDLFAMTSRYEPFGLVLLEAAASGLPIVMIPGSGGSLELGRRLGATILSDRCPSAFAAAVASLATDPAHRNRQACEEVLREYSWESSAARLADLYRHLCPPSAHQV
mgnify:CR=1 FL=1